MGTGSPVTIDDIFALFKETEERIEKLFEETSSQMRETDRYMKELAEETSSQMKETDRILKENADQMKETDLMIKELRRSVDRTYKKLGTSWMDEYFRSNAHGIFQEIGYSFDYRYKKRFYDSGTVIAEVDCWFEDSEHALVMEVKQTFGLQDLVDYKALLEKIRQCMNASSDKRKLLGAVAAERYEKGTDVIAMIAGFYVLTKDCENAHLMEAPYIWKPKEIEITRRGQKCTEE